MQVKYMRISEPMTDEDNEKPDNCAGCHAETEVEQYFTGNRQLSAWLCIICANLSIGTRMIYRSPVSHSTIDKDIAIMTRMILTAIRDGTFPEGFS